MKLLNWEKYGKTINVIILMKLLKGHYTSFFILLSMFLNNSHLYWYSYFETVPKNTSVLII